MINNDNNRNIHNINSNHTNIDTSNNRGWRRAVTRACGAVDRLGAAERTEQGAAAKTYNHKQHNTNT